ncbi:MAG: hypothetical protein GH143_01575 [Calditrichaeota bacterium]|nr:hypothetical protein [Calditrichota bacterium]
MIIDEMEKKLRAPEIELKPYPSKVITLASGERMVVREVRREETGVLLGTIHPLMGVPKDFYDIVAARMFAEILGWYRYRVANEFILVGAIDGVIAGIVNSRLVDGNIGMSLHTLAIKRGLRVGAQLFAAKMEHHLEILGQEEVYIVAESPIGFKRWMIEYELENRAAEYPQVRHELGGIPTHVLTRALYDAVRDQKVTGKRPVDPAVLATAENLKMPDEYAQIPGFKRGK